MPGIRGVQRPGRGPLLEQPPASVLLVCGQALTGIELVAWLFLLVGPLVYGTVGILLRLEVFVLANCFDFTAAGHPGWWLGC